MEDLETNQIFSRQEIDPQPQVVCRRELLPPNWHLKGQAGAPLAAASSSWQLCCHAMWKEPFPGSTHTKLVAAAGKPHVWHLDIFALRGLAFVASREGVLAGSGSQYVPARLSDPMAVPVGQLCLFTPQKRPAMCSQQMPCAVSAGVNVESGPLWVSGTLRPCPEPSPRPDNRAVERKCR